LKHRLRSLAAGLRTDGSGAVKPVLSL
jgi:hypothetical protein